MLTIYSNLKHKCKVKFTLSLFAIHPAADIDELIPAMAKDDLMTHL